MSDEPDLWWPDAVLDRHRWGALVAPVLDRIAAARDRGRFPHALLLTGPAGLGRELAAVEAAVMLACDGADDPWSVSSCADRVRNGQHPDVRAVLPQGKSWMITIEQIRDITDEASGRPFEARCRVWILDGVEAAGFGDEAANAFLKTLEEPPGHVRLLLLAANPTAVLPTIRSRCQQLALPGPSTVGDDAVGAGIPPELSAMAMSGVKLAPILADIRTALEAAAEGESRHLLRLPHVIGDEVGGFEVVAAVAAQMAAEVDNGDAAEGLARLAVDLLTTERRSRALNLNDDRQLVSCLLRWFQDT